MWIESEIEIPRPNQSPHTIRATLVLPISEPASILAGGPTRVGSMQNPFASAEVSPQAEWDALSSAAVHLPPLTINVPVNMTFGTTPKLRLPNPVERTSALAITSLTSDSSVPFTLSEVASARLDSPVDFAAVVDAEQRVLNLTLYFDAAARVFAGGAGSQQNHQAVTLTTSQRSRLRQGTSAPLALMPAGNPSPAAALPSSSPGAASASAKAPLALHKTFSLPLDHPNVVQLLSDLSKLGPSGSVRAQRTPGQRIKRLSARAFKSLRVSVEAREASGVQTEWLVALESGRSAGVVATECMKVSPTVTISHPSNATEEQVAFLVGLSRQSLQM